MRKENIRFLKVFGAGALLVCVTLLCKVLSLRVADPFLNKGFVYLRDCIFIGLFCFWGFSVKKRIMQIQVRRFLLAVAALMLFWFMVREFKFRFVMSAEADRYLWYLYYVPLLLVPILALSISLSLGKGESYRLPRWIYLIYVPTLALIFLVLTNDLHQFAFRFTDPAHRDEWHYVYGWLYYLVSAWIYGCSLLSLLLMLTKLRSPRGKRILWMPFVPIAVALIYGVLYAIQNEFVHHLFGDISAVFCLVFIAFFEICIRCSLIHSNSRYADLFYASEGISAQITDNDYTLCYRASDAGHIDEAQMRLAESGPIVLEDKQRLCNNPIAGGHAIWTEDISALLAAREMLESRGEELAERNALLQLEYEKEREHKRIEEQNRLYDLLQSKTQTQLDTIETLIGLYKTTDEQAQKQRILAKIIVLGSFIKRRKNFVLTADEAPVMPESVLSGALGESYRSLRLIGIQGAFLVQFDEAYQDAQTLIAFYDFFEYILESVMDQAQFINVVAGDVGVQKRIRISVDVLKDLAVQERFPGARCVQEDDGSIYLFTAEGGVGS